MFMRWLHLAFIHWPVDAAALRPLIPSGLELDTFEGTAWVGLVPFTMRDVSHVTPLGRIAVPTATHFHECNVRTYVRGPGGVASVWFFSLDAASRLAVCGARAGWNLPYHLASMTLHRRGDTIEYATARRSDPGAAMTAAWEAGPILPPSAPGTLLHFLTERYALSTVSRSGRVRTGRIAHPHWPLRSARLLRLSDGLVRAAGITVSGEPLVHHADEIAVEAFAPERADR